MEPLSPHQTTNAAAIDKQAVVVIPLMTGLLDAAALLADDRVVLVMEDGNIVGQVTHQIVLRSLTRHGSLSGITTAEVDLSPVQTICLSDWHTDAIAQIAQNKSPDTLAQSLVLVDDTGYPVGTIAPAVLCKLLASQLTALQDQIKALRSQHLDTCEQLQSVLCDQPTSNGWQAQDLDLVATHQALLAAVPDLLIRMTRDGTYLDFFPAKDLRIVTPVFMPGINLFNVMPRNISELRMSYVEKALDTGQTQVYEYELPLDGRIYYREDRIAVINSNEVLVLARDISDRKEKELEHERAEAALRESEARFRTMADSAPVLLWMTGVDGRATFFNQTWLAFTGRTLDQELGLGWTDGLHADDAPRCLDAYWTAIQHQQPFNGEFRLKKADGSYAWVINKAMPRYLPNGAFAGYIGSCVDISDRKQAEADLRQSEQRLNLHRQNTPLAVVEWDIEGQIVDWNSAATEIFGYTRAEAIGAHAINLLVPDSWRSQVYHVQQLLITERHSVRSSNENKTKDGQIICCEWYNTPLVNPEGQIFGIASLALDITQRKRVERALQEANALLEQRVSDRTQQLHQTNHQLTQEIAERKHIEQRLRENEIRLHLINSISTGITAGMPVSQVVQTTILHLSQYFPAYRVSYSTLHPSGRLRVLHTRTPEQMTSLQGAELDLSGSDALLTALQQHLEPVVIHDITENPLTTAIRDAMLSQSTRSILALPLPYCHDMTGLLSFVAPHPHDWSDHEITTLTEVADYLAVVLQEEHIRDAQQQIERALLESQQENALLAIALEHAGDAIEITNHEQVIEYVNPAGEVISGYSRAEMLGRKPKHLFRSSKHSDEFYDEISAILNRGEVWRGNLVARRKDGSLCYLETTIAPVFDSEGQVIHQVAVKRDVTDRRRVEESLRLTQFSLDHAVDAAFWLRSDGKFTYVNKAACRQLDYNYIDLLLMSMRDIAPYLPNAEWEERWRQLLEQKAIRFETCFHTRQGKLFPVEMTLNYLKFNGVDYCFAFARDLTERRQAEEALRLRNQAIFASSNGIVIADARQPDMPVIFVNPAFERMTGYALEEILGRNCRFLQGSDRNQPALDEIRSALQSQRSCSVILRNYRKDGSQFWNEVSISPIFDDRGTLTHFVGIQTDISDRIQVEQNLQASLEEKELLLREVHHRVKNNLQVISSIFSLQSQYVDHPDILSLLTESQDRIRSMALIHENLYQSDSLARIDFADYIRNLVRNLFISYNIYADQLDLQIQVEAIPLNIDSAIPCGLLLNELVSNALKHGFPNGAKGTLQIQFEQQENQQFRLLVRDSGKGLSNDFDFNQVNSLGLRLVRALTRQLNGQLTSRNENGAVFEVLFPLANEQ
jgi:PAS domain S-box-containing protein